MKRDNTGRVKPKKKKKTVEKIVGLDSKDSASKNFDAARLLGCQACVRIAHLRLSAANLRWKDDSTGKGAPALDFQGCCGELAHGDLIPR